MEKRDLYDKNRILTGETVYKGEKIPIGRYITVVIVFIQNSKGEFLIQKRSEAKDGKYGSTGGHPKSGETSLEGMVTEIKEELGLDVYPHELNLVYSNRQDPGQVFFDVYFLKKDFDIADLTLQKEEVDFVEWVSIDEMESMMAENLFLPSHTMCFYKLLEVLGNKILPINFQNNDLTASKTINENVSHYKILNNNTLGNKKLENESYIGKILNVKIDRPMGSKHPKHGFIYPVNYGYVPNTISGDGEELDCYVLAVFEPLEEFTGKCIAIIHRTDDNDDKLIIVPENRNMTDDEINILTEFQERFFKHIIIR